MKVTAIESFVASVPYRHREMSSGGGVGRRCRCPDLGSA